MEIWDVTIMKMGSIKIVADTQQEAIKKVEEMEISEKIMWEDDWNAVDACISVTAE